ncbi:MAG: CYTH domain-containing protein [Desulfobulbus sp.]|nr:CYTH domain-containing protein [Desulfobulbus sp.]
MAQEIERKFLLANDQWRSLVQGVQYRQGYLHADRTCTVRVRIAGKKGFLTIKGATVGIGRNEYEYPIPLDEARAMLDELCPHPQIEKIRYTIPFAGFTWEVDEFFGENQGLIVAEIELEHEEQSFDKPTWVGEEVTGDKRYYNAALCKNPFSLW